MPGIEPGPPGWKPGILTTRPHRIMHGVESLMRSVLRPEKKLKYIWRCTGQRIPCFLWVWGRVFRSDLKHDRHIYLSHRQSGNRVKYLSRLVTKPTKWHVCPVNSQISLGIRPYWSEPSLCAQWVAKDPRFLHADSEDWSDWADTWDICQLFSLERLFVSFIQILKNSTLLAVVVKLCTYHVFPQRGVVGIPWGLDCQNSHCPRGFDRRLWHRGVTLDFSARKSRRNYAYIWWHAQGIWDTKLCLMGRELDPNFSKWSNSLGQSRLSPSGGKTLIGAPHALNFQETLGVAI